MSQPEEITPENGRILIVDDTKSIHADFKKVLSTSSESKAELDDFEASLFGDDDAPSGEKAAAPVSAEFEIDSAFQGQEALEMVEKSLANNRPYAMAFIDVRMPPGWDGVETLSRIWEVDPNLQAVICTAYSDCSWDEMIERLGNPDRLLILKKPFENIEVLQAANALVSKWNWQRKAAIKMDGLESAVVERTKKVVEQKAAIEQQLEELQETRLQLVQSEKLASVGQLAAGVAHEINNPVGYISSNLNTLRDYVSDIQKITCGYREITESCVEIDGPIQEKALAMEATEKQIDLDFVLEDLDALLGDAIEGTQRVKKIVGDLSEFSHVNSQDVVEEDINALLEKTLSVASNETKYKAEIECEFGDLPAIKCFGGKLGQVFLNLIINAAQSMEDKGTIKIKTGKNDLDDSVWVEIQDTGSGIEEEHLAKIFDPFFTTKDVGKGTGLGLHIVQSVIESHQGKISVDSTVGVGTVFRIELPIDADLSEDPEQEQGSNEQSSGTNEQPSGAMDANEGSVQDALNVS